MFGVNVEEGLHFLDGSSIIILLLRLHLKQPDDPKAVSSQRLIFKHGRRNPTPRGLNQSELFCPAVSWISDFFVGAGINCPGTKFRPWFLPSKCRLFPHERWNKTLVILNDRKSRFGPESINNTTEQPKTLSFNCELQFCGVDTL